MAKNIVTLNLDNTDYSIRPYGTCSTAAATAAKTVSITGFTLCAGATVLVKFDNTNSATSPTLNINSTGDKPIKRKGVSNDVLDANVYYEFIYDGTNWIVIGEADTKVTSVDNHYTPTENTVSQLSAEASGATAAWSIDVVKGVTIKRDAKGHVTGVDVTSGKIPANPNTDTKVTSVDNHYVPVENTTSQLSAEASGATAAWNIDVVKGITIKRDAKGHVTGVNVTSGKIPANPNTDTKNTAGSTNNASKMYLIGAPSQAANPQTYSNSKIYATDGVLTTERGINLYKSTGDSPALTFLRGTTADDLTDWRMFVSSGVFKIQNQIRGGGWVDILSFANPSTSTITSSYHILPSANNTLDLGSSSYKWRNIYGSLKGNADTATNVTNVYESKIKWGNNNISGGLSPIDVALDSQWSANRLSFMPANDILVEYSTDGGVVWEDYGLTDAQKQSLVTTGLSTTIYPGKNSTRQKTTDKVRVTITAAASKTYFSLKKIYSYLSTSGASETKVKIEKSMCGSDATFVDVGDYSVSGWSGWNSIPLAANFGGGDNQTGNIRKLRLTFYFTSYGNNYGETDDKNAVKFQISKISMIGETSWANSGGSLSATGHLYSYDVNKTATFPAALKATTIYENGIALSEKYALQKATSDNFGGIKLGYSQSGKNYPVQLSDGKAYVNVPWTDTDTDTKNTAGATNSASKMYLIGALSQEANPQTYSNSNVYATNGELTATKFNGGLKGISATSVNNCNGDKLLKYFTLSGCTATEATNNKRYAGTADSYGFPVSSNANGLLWLGNHSTNYGHQLGFSSDGKIYHRSITNGSFPTTANGGSWKTIAFTSDIPSKYEHPKAGKNVGSFGISTNVTIDHGESLIIPYITVDSDGHVTAASNVSITLPSQYILPVATANTLGGIKIGYSENNKKYAVKLDDNDKAYVEVPWETYSNATTSKAGLMSTTDKSKLDNIVAATNEEIDNLF